MSADLPLTADGDPVSPLEKVEHWLKHGDQTDVTCTTCDEGRRLYRGVLDEAADRKAANNND